MPTLTATAGSATANSYITVADATTYFDERIQATAWSDEDADDQARALIMATRRLDEERYQGEKVATSQALKWPRSSAFTEDGYEYDTSAVPEIVKQATCEVALQILKADDAGSDPLANTGLEGFESLKVGPIEIKTKASFLAAQLSETVTRMLDHVITSSSYSATIHRA